MPSYAIELPTAGSLGSRELRARAAAQPSQPARQPACGVETACAGVLAMSTAPRQPTRAATTAGRHGARRDRCRGPRRLVLGVRVRPAARVSFVPGRIRVRAEHGGWLSRLRDDRARRQHHVAGRIAPLAGGGRVHAAGHGCVVRAGVVRDSAALSLGAHRRILRPRPPAARASRTVHESRPSSRCAPRVTSLLWSALSWLLRRASFGLERAADPESSARRMRAISYAGLPLLALTSGLAGFEWFMSLSPDFSSTMFGAIWIALCLFGGIACTIVLVGFAQRTRALAIGPSHYSALGRLLLAFLVFLGYVEFFQFMLCWIGNLPSEAHWYVARAHGVYAYSSAFLMLGQFFLPFFALLSYRRKRRIGPLAWSPRGACCRTTSTCIGWSRPTRSRPGSLGSICSRWWRCSRRRWAPVCGCSAANR